jgi:hypothetical protein
VRAASAARTVAFALAFLCVALAACGGGGGGSGAPGIPGQPAFSPYPGQTPTPPPNHLYLDHNGMFYAYSLPLSSASKPLLALAEGAAGLVPPNLAVDPYGNVVIASATQLEFFRPPIHSFAPSAAKLIVPLTPAITEMGPSGAALTDVEFDPSGNLWLLNDIGGEVTELLAPITKKSVAATTLTFGTAGTKTAGFGELQDARFDINATLYVLAGQSQGSGALLFKTGFPYTKPVSGYFGLDLAYADFVDPSQFPNGPPQNFASGFLIGQYVGLLASPAPTQSAPPPSEVLAQFTMPIVSALGVFPQVTIDTITGALTADAPRSRLYTLDAPTGALDVYTIPLSNGAAPVIKLPCAGQSTLLCNGKPEHIFLAP